MSTKTDKVEKIAKDFNTLFVKNFDKEYDRFNREYHSFRKATYSLRHIPPERLRLPMD